MRKTTILLILFLFKMSISKAQLLAEDFNYTGNLSANGWVSYESGDALVTTSGLSFTGYAGSGTGNAALVKRLPSSSGQDAYKTFTEQNTPGAAVYTCFLLKVTDTLLSAKSGNYVFHLGHKTLPSGALSFAATLYIKQLSTGAIQFGINNSGTAQFTTGNYPVSGTYLVILKYTLAATAGGANEVKMWIRSSGGYPATETAVAPSLTHTTTIAPGLANTKINCVALRQNNSVANVPQVVIDGIRVSNTWAGIQDTLTPPNPPDPPADSCDNTIYPNSVAPPAIWDSIANRAANGNTEAQKHVNARPMWMNYFATFPNYCAVPYAPLPGKLRNLPDKPTAPRFTLTGKIWPLPIGGASICLWEDDKVAAVSHSIDDNQANDVADWMQISRNYGGLNLTWNLITGNMGGQLDPSKAHQTGTWAFWQKVVDSGFQVQSHSVSHAADLVLEDGWGGPNFELEESRKQIDAHLPGRKTKLFAYPGSGISWFNITGSWRPGVSKFYAAARNVSINPPINQANMIDYFKIATTSNPTKYIYDSAGVVPFRAILDTTGLPASYHKYYRGWATVFIHSLFPTGVNIGANSNPIIASFADVFNFFNQHRDSLWIGFLADVALYGQERDMGTVTTAAVTDTAIRINLTSQMDPDIFDYPLTVKVRVPNTWAQVSATQNGLPVPSSMLEHADSSYVLVKAKPDRGQVVIRPDVTALRVVRADKKERLLTIIPNPTTNDLKTEIPEAKQGAVLYVTAMSGAVILQQPVAKGSKTAKLYVASLAKGIYLLTYVNGDHQRLSATFIKN
jgi:hypothetical protein